MMDEEFRMRRDSFSKSLLLNQVLVCDKLAESISLARHLSSVYPDLFDEFSKSFAMKYDDAKTIHVIIADERRHSKDLLSIYDRLCLGKK